LWGELRRGRLALNEKDEDGVKIYWYRIEMLNTGLYAVVKTQCIKGARYMTDEPKKY
jgi:hypothetical protein